MSRERSPLPPSLADSLATTARLPERIVCLTGETTETLYLVGAMHQSHDIVTRWSTDVSSAH